MDIQTIYKKLYLKNLKNRQKIKKYKIKIKRFKKKKIK